MNLSKRDQSLLLTLIGLIIFFASYVGVYNNLNSRTDEVKSDISELYPRLVELQRHNKNLPAYNAGITESIEKVEVELMKYPGDVRPEGLLNYVMELEKDIGIKVSSVSFIPAQLFSRFQLVSQGDNGSEFVPMAAMKTGFSASCRLSYPQLKRLVNYIYANEHYTTLDSISIYYDAESGELTGSVDISKYFVTSAEYSYDHVTLPQVPLGTADPFGTFAVAPVE